MTPLIENSQLATDLDCGWNALLNAANLLPVPAQFVDINDPSMSDPRYPLSGSVTDDSVAANAGITQDKLLLDGSIPTVWLGVGSNTAAEGDLAERVANKNQPNGYPGLDTNGKIALSRLPSTGPSSGTVTEVAMATPPDLLISGSPIHGSGVFSLSWRNAPGYSLLQNFSSTPAPPSFSGAVLSVSLMPSLDASKFTTGVFPSTLFPVSSEMGIGHAPGVLPDPGDGSSGFADDYLGRDMEWHRFEVPIAYQPYCDDVQITFMSVYGDSNYVSIASPQEGSNLFLRTGGTGNFSEVASPITILSPPGEKIEAYASKAGYNNSDIAEFISPPI